MEGKERRVSLLFSPLLAKCPHGMPSMEGAVDRNEIPHVLLILCLYLVILKSPLPLMKASHSVIMQSAWGWGKQGLMGGFQRASGFIPFPFSSWRAHPVPPLFRGKLYQVAMGG